ncbi:MAG TPA: low temperature requirement protein A [Chloroflexota bacterium]|nr:low temperature requirement protein A [Chloroflexota bacterium]
MSDTPTEATRVTTLELFFDLVFVFTITQLTTVLAREPNVRGVLQVALMLGVIWWMYGGYAWLTNAVAPDRAERRLLLFGGMAAFLVLALALPRAFSDSGPAFGLAYLAVVSVHTVMFTRASSARTVRAIVRLAPYNLVSALVVLLACLIGGTAEYLLWALAVVLEWVTPRLSSTSGFEIAPAHFVERHGLVVLIAIGESVVAIGSGAIGLRVDLPRAGVAVLGLLLSACLWWTYFGGDDQRAEHALTEATPDRRPSLALSAFGYWHLPMLLGIIAIASALREIVGHAFTDLTDARAFALAGGVALFLLGDVFYRRSLGIGSNHWRAGMGALALATIPLGAAVAATAQLAALVALLGAGFGAEYLAASRKPGAEEQRRGDPDEPEHMPASEVVRPLGE